MIQTQIAASDEYKEGDIVTMQGNPAIQDNATTYRVGYRLSPDKRQLLLTFFNIRPKLKIRRCIVCSVVRTTIERRDLTPPTPDGRFIYQAHLESCLGCFHQWSYMPLDLG